MAREYTLEGDLTPPTIKVDLSPGFYGFMERAYSELEVYRAENVTINFEITQNGQPFNLTDYTVKFQGKEAFGDTAFIFDKTATKTDATNGKAQVALTGADLVTSSATDEKTVETQLFLTQAGLTNTVMQFPIRVLPAVWQ